MFPSRILSGGFLSFAHCTQNRLPIERCIVVEKSPPFVYNSIISYLALSHTHARTRALTHVDGMKNLSIASCFSATIWTIQLSFHSITSNIHLIKSDWNFNKPRIVEFFQSQSLLMYDIIKMCTIVTCILILIYCYRPMHSEPLVTGLKFNFCMFS